MRPEDFLKIIEIGRLNYPQQMPWNEQQLQSHLQIFSEGQFVAVEKESGEIVGSASSLIVDWDDYTFDTSWKDFTGSGYFTNHNPQKGRTLYAADVMVDPRFQSHGIGKKLYQEARFGLADRLHLRRVRAGARLRGYHRFAKDLSPEEYVARVVRGELRDPTLTFQVRQGFQSIGVVGGYLKNDPESLGYAAIIEWLNPKWGEKPSGRS